MSIIGGSVTRVVSSSTVVYDLIKGLENNVVLNIGIRDIHASSYIQYMGIRFLDIRVMFHEEFHGLVVNFMRENNVTRVLEGTVFAHFNKLFVEAVNSFNSNTG